MKLIDLKVSPKLKAWLINSLEESLDSDGELLLVRGEENGVDEAIGWGMTIASQETMLLCKINKKNQVEVDGLECIISAPEFSHELEGMYLNWNEQGMKLERRNE